MHRLVATTYISNPQNLAQVNHIDGNLKNNNVSNLEWVSNRENTQHAYDTGLNSKAVKVQVVDTETKEVIEYPSLRQASEAIGYSLSWLHWAFRNKGNSFKLQTKLIRKAGENHVK
ncbi:HNH endonuclease [Mammaliicoccus sciuri]|uniref:HNH endonuclease n=1 Tax=Mammaliicoccus sciuri TaxID=1296 RepID=UPI0021CFDFBA|nr:HNH endonuclease [Mammaliicoccus sciuri]UXV14883.1 HNH endonuclease [Mammaliicoccus sciuri]UXV25925.1 HNH endonuclease [Mammaliicoccus sciuri]